MKTVLWIVITLLGVMTQRVSASQPVLFFAAPDGSGSACTLEQPCSLEAAQARVRAATPQMTSDIVVRLLDGTYRLGHELLFDAARSDGGLNGRRVVYEAQPGARPVLSAGLTIHEWTTQSASPLWIARLPEGFETRQIYVDGVRATRARGALPTALSELPGIGYEAQHDGLSHWHRPQDLELVYDFAWKRVRCGVAAIAGREILMDQPCFDNAIRGALTPHNALVFAENALELIDEPGEWYLDSEAGRLFYKPFPWQDPQHTVAVLANLESLVRGVGTPEATLRNLTLRGITFAHAGWTGSSGEDGFVDLQANQRLTGNGAYRHQGTCQTLMPAGSCPFGAWSPIPANISFTATDNLLLERNTFTHLGGAGLRLGDYVTNTRVVGNVFRDISGNGIEIGGVGRTGADDPSPLPSDNTVSNNWISEVGAEYASAVGVFQGYAQRSLIVHNQLNALPYSGISSGWGWGYNQTGSTGTAIRANLVFDHMLTLHDGGGIYTLGEQGSSIADGTDISVNFVHGQRNFGISIYTDAGSRYMTVHHNVLFDNYVFRDVAGCFIGQGTTMGDMIVSHNWWQHSPPTWDCLDIPPDTFTVEHNELLLDVNGAPSAIRDTAGLELAYADVRADAASGFDLAHRKPCTASSLEGGPLTLERGHGCGASLDGDAGSYAAASGSATWSLDIDLLDLQDIDRVRVLLPPSAAASALQVLLSVDGTAFQAATGSVALRSGWITVTFPAQAARFVRVITAGPQLAEVGVYGRPDNALHKDARAQYVDGRPSFMQVGSLASLAVDGLGATFSHASGEWRWVQLVDLGSVRPIDRVIVTSALGAYATAYHIDGSLDGASWSTLASVTDGQPGARAVDFASSLVRHLRIVADKPDDFGQLGGQMTVVRFSAYGAPDAASGAAVRAEYLDGTPATPHPDGAAEHAVDGKLSSHAQPQAQWRWQLHVDLGAQRALHEVDVLMPASAFATAFHIDSSADGTTWETQARTTTVGLGGLVQSLMPDDTHARYLRIVADAPDGPGQVGHQMAISELSIY